MRAVATVHRFSPLETVSVFRGSCVVCCRMFALPLNTAAAARQALGHLLDCSSPEWPVRAGSSHARRRCAVVLHVARCAWPVARHAELLSVALNTLHVAAVGRPAQP